MFSTYQNLKTRDKNISYFGIFLLLKIFSKNFEKPSLKTIPKAQCL